LVSIVIPTLNEELTIGEFIDWCHEGLQKAGVTGQILIIDSSTDNTPEIARSKGADVVCTPKRGLGRAYIDSIPHIRGRYIIMGDADLTYDFREILPFIEKLEEGYEFVMGSRYLGYIEPGAMPPLHRYFGTPFTTWILNTMFGTRYSDIHCGMRAITLDALKRINLTSQSWEYASEMVLKARRYNLKISEVPIRFYKDREGRLSHLKRAGWMTPWKAGWINLRVMLLYGADFFLLIPGLILFIVSFLFTTSLVGGQYSIGEIFFNLHWMLLGLTLTTLGYSAMQLGVISRIYNNFDNVIIGSIKRIITYDRGVITGLVLFACGFLLNVNLTLRYVHEGLRLDSIYYPGVFGLLLMILGFQTFTFTLLLQMMLRNFKPPEQEQNPLQTNEAGKKETNL
jgi:glycosyltransferase involved in cell wall biosynthesis